MSDPVGFSLSDAMDLAGVGLDELWWRYAAIGGTAGPTSLALFVRDAGRGDRREYDLVAQALNEAFLDRGHDSFPTAYCGPSAVVPTVPESTTSTPRSREARRQAALARSRSAAAARQSAELHATAAQLMLASGQLQFAGRARIRAEAARQRADASAAA